MQRHFWTVVETKTQAARRARAALEELGFQTYLPEYRGSLVDGVRRTLNAFPNYIFVRVTRSNWTSLYRADDVRKVFERGNFVHVVEKQFVEAIRSMEDHRGYVVIERLEAWLPGVAKFMPGQMVSGVRGMLHSIPARFVEYLEDDFARVSVSVFGGREMYAIVDVHELVGC